MASVTPDDRLFSNIRNTFFSKKDGIDFKVGFAGDRDGQQWLLRIPRRDDLGNQIEKEKRIIDLRQHIHKKYSAEIPILAHWLNDEIT